jgi:hypothetical protein
MKYILLVSLLMWGCNNDTSTELPISDKDNTFQDVGKNFPINANCRVQIITIDDCEYIVWSGSHGEVGFAHKGNCKNHIHIYNK